LALKDLAGPAMSVALPVSGFFVELLRCFHGRVRPHYCYRLVKYTPLDFELYFLLPSFASDWEKVVDFVVAELAVA
jgi:hypothetical protein